MLSWSRGLSKLRSTWLLRKRISPVSPVFCSLAALLYLYPFGPFCPFCPLPCSRYGFAQGARSIYHRLQKKADRRRYFCLPDFIQLNTVAALFYRGSDGLEPLFQMLPPLNILVPDKSKLRIEQVNFLKEFKSAFGFGDDFTHTLFLILHTSSINVVG